MTFDIKPREYIFSKAVIGLGENRNINPEYADLFQKFVDRESFDRLHEAFMKCIEQRDEWIGAGHGDDLEILNAELAEILRGGG